MIEDNEEEGSIMQTKNGYIGQFIALKCNYEGDNITWSFNGHMLLRNAWLLKQDQILIIENIELWNVGTYTCATVEPDQIYNQFYLKVIGTFISPIDSISIVINGNR